MATDAMTIRLSRFAAGNPIFIGNERGRSVFQELQKQIEAVPEIDVFGISLDGISATDASFPRESVVSLAKMLRGEKGFYLEGIENNDLLDNWDYAAKAKDQYIIVRQRGKKYRVIGPELHEPMKDLLDFVMEEGRVTTAKVAKRFDISVQNASARMKRLHLAGLVLGSKESAETGGLEYLFRAIQ
jgi:hypothetical protein